jgi:MFS family permease
MAEKQIKQGVQLSVRHRHLLKRIHFISTVWFFCAVAYFFLFSLRQAGESWWVIISLSGYSTSLAFLLISLYLFAIFRGMTRSQKIENEHPVTASFYYMMFYVVSPLLGGFAGALSGIQNTWLWNYFLVVAVGTFWATFVIWIIIDPAAGFLEVFLPTSSRYRKERLLEAEALRKQERIAKQRILTEVERAEKSEQSQWEKVLRPYAQELARLLADGGDGRNSIESQVVNIGLIAWRMGGLNCMRKLQSMVADTCEKQRPVLAYENYIAIWWDGIGSWHSDWLDVEKDTANNDVALNGCRI